MNGYGYQLKDHDDLAFSIAFTEAIDSILSSHLDKGIAQEDLVFAYWRPSIGASRYTAIIHKVVLPEAGDRELHGNVAFTSQYLNKVLRSAPKDSGIALLHSHLGPGWQDMSQDDIVAERDRMGGAVAARTNLPVIGLTRGTDGVWSGRFWFRAGPNIYQRKWASTIRVVGRQLRISHHPNLSRIVESNNSQAATISVWGDKAQATFARAHIGIVGLGSVGSILAESLSRTGSQRITLIDFDRLEERNLDRILHAKKSDVDNS